MEVIQGGLTFENTEFRLYIILQEKGIAIIGNMLHSNKVSYSFYSTATQLIGKTVK